MNITLTCDDQGFGFWVVGGSEDGTQVKVGSIKPGSAAAVDGRLQTGDEILCCNNECVINASHRRVVRLIRSAGRRFGYVSLTIRRSSTLYRDCYSTDVLRNAADSCDTKPATDNRSRETTSFKEDKDIEALL